MNQPVAIIFSDGPAPGLGMLAISLLGRLPYVGGLVVFIALLIGLRALVLQVMPRTADSAPAQ